MTGSPRSAWPRTEPDARLKTHPPDEPDHGGGGADTGRTEIPRPQDDPDDPWSPPADLDAEITAAARALFFSRDLVRSGPGLLPFGSKARDRSRRRREVDALAAARRAALAELLTARRTSRAARGRRSVRFAHPRLVAAALTAVVITISAAGWWMARSTTPTGPVVTKVGNGPAPAGPALAGSNTESVPATPTSVSDVTSGPDAGVDWSLASPEAAAESWLAAWCTFDPNANPEDTQARTRAAMTAAGWAQFAGTSGSTMAGAVAGATASCGTPSARIVSHPPGTDVPVVVLVWAIRSVFDPENLGRAGSFRIERRQYVVMGDDGLWRVDVAAVGG